MPTTAAVIAQLTPDDATWRAARNAISAAIGVAGGLVRVTQSAAWATAVRPAAGTFSADSVEVYRFNDALQATSPVFLRVRYGSSNPIGKGRLEFQVGRGHDGAGNLTTDAGTATVISGAGDLTTATARLDASSRPDGLALALYPDLGNAKSALVLLGRGKDNAGAPRSDRIHFALADINSSASQFVRIWRPIVGWAGGANVGLGVPNIGGQAHMRNVGGDIALVFPMVLSGSERWQIVSALVYGAGDVADDTVFDAPLPDGTVGHFKAMGTRIGGNSWVSGTAAAIAGNAMAIRWE